MTRQEPRRQVEYTVAASQTLAREFVLNSLGKQGWELVTTIYHEDSEVYRDTLMREV